ncbi:vacuolar protein sorting-associated protein 13B isoform X2 [Pseudomyrmex gracilis]|uniref:vacuolar protein sorting-associated protein 13B isoform X2 n=1 Tax=Pseudomyrmex gracilis TaxID=219809 RepID=UPI0009959979|nr:vacuolar protein sorting-associated protein 13B isoform X2 [Pseudomyrmex gracilis]
MFKLESYIAPVIISCVEKYVKNLKPEQSQVSLWEGDAYFQNLDLRSEVLEEQLNLPFVLVSGHIHGLFIHVPWVKITSEPIVVTINTIECILKLKDENTTKANTPTLQKKNETVQEKTPPGYIKNIVTKVINNITIKCNNLILKYVEEDIVLSVNVRFLSMQTVDDKWKPTFADVNNQEVMLRKIITIEDLTLCLDKMDASGKIEIYQDPVLYRCSMTIRMIINYHNNISKRASVTRLDLHCEKMEFSITEQQVPMLLRLAALLLALQTKQFPPCKEKSSTIVNERDVVQDDTSQIASTSTDVGWGWWAWDLVSSVLPGYWDNEWSAEQQLAYSSHNFHLGLYIDDATVTFKTVESVKEQLFYKSRKLRYKSFLSLQLNGVVIDTIIQGISMTTFQVGVACIQLYPRGPCSCGHLEVVDGVQPPLYVTAGNVNDDYLEYSLFDKEAVENKGEKRDYILSMYYHLTAREVFSLFERCPALVMDYVYRVEIPDDITPEKLLELRSNSEYSNFKEYRVTRYVGGDITVRLCSGFFHRIDTIKEAAAKYDYNPYLVIKPDPLIDELSHFHSEECTALWKNLSTTETRINLYRASLQLQLADHCVRGIPRKRKIVEFRITPLSPALTDDPFVSIECDEVNATLVQPMYPFRLVACASKAKNLPPEMFTHCHAITNIKVTGAKSQLHLTKTCDTSIVMPYSVEASSKLLVYPQYWRNVDMVSKSYSFRSDSITVTGTKAKLMAAVSIVTSVFSPADAANLLTCSTLFNDACQEKCPVYLELYLENINCKNVLSSGTISSKVNIHSVKIFALNDSQQTIILSGPENCNGSDTENVPLFSAVVQFPKTVEQQTHPSLVSFKIAEIRASLDPLFLEWLEYRATYHKSGSAPVLRSNSRQLVTETSSDTATRKKTFPSLHESVHSSSDKDKKKSAVTEKSKTLRNDEAQKKSESKLEEQQQKTGILVKLAESYSWWCSLVLSGYVGHIIIYIPSETMSGIGADGIEKAKDRALAENQDLQIMIVKLPSLQIHSSNVNAESLSPYLRTLPVKLQESMWTRHVQSFPWTLSLIDFHCYTLQQQIQKNFIKKVTLNATVALTTKTATTQSNTLTALSVCVHIDNSPIIVSLSEEQVIFMRNIALNIIKVLRTQCNSQDDVAIASQISNDTQIVLPIIPQTSSSPTQITYQEDTTTNSTVSTSKDDQGCERDGLVITAWIQWTITKVAVKLYIIRQNTSSLKLMLELEDIITSLDLQSVYMQLKSKITTATIFHYVRSPRALNWDVGDYAGLVLCGREDSLEKGDDSGFVSFTLTRAKSGNVYTRWGTHKRQKSQKKELLVDSALSRNSYISEIFIKMQMVDVILPLSVISNYTQLIQSFALLGSSIEKSTDVARKSASTPLIGITNLNNESLPLIHLEFKGFRLMLPVLTDTIKLQHDLLMLQLDGIRITPDAENPICRTPLRTDIYQLAAQANILNVPGSAVEDRQYQISVKGVCAYTTTWKNYQLSINKRMSQSYLYTMNENPALEWNKLGNGSSLDPYFSTSPVLTKFDLCLIIAPAVTYKTDTIVCGSAMEVNCITDIELIINLDQIKLISVLNNEFMTLLSESFEKAENKNDSNNLVQRVSSGSQSVKPVSCLKQVSDDSELDFAKDSGVDFEMSSMHSAIIGKPGVAKAMIFPPFEFLVNCGKMTFILYEVQNTFSDLEDDVDVHKIDTEDDNNNIKQPLLYLMINQPNIYFSQQYLYKKIQVSCFDITIALGDAQSLNTIPTEKDFKIYMIETKHGDPHPDTGIPPSFVTIKSETILGKNRQVLVEMGRPTKVHLSLSRINQLYTIQNKVLSCFLDDKIAQVPVEEKEAVLTENSTASTKSRKFNIPDLHLSTKQIVLSLKTDSGAEIIASLASLNKSLSTLVRPDRIYSNLSIDSFIISAILNGNIKVLLNPWCCNVTSCLLWESSYSNEIVPQIQIQADSESLYLDFGPDQIKIIKTVVQDFQLLLSEYASSSASKNKNEKQMVLLTEQHYKDDLKAGAFQFVDGTADELPFPYQVVFFAYPQQAMAWRYPQPRTLTRIHISPVPFETVDANGNYIDRIFCVLEYWSDSHMSYQRYADFYLSETDSYRIELPEKAPARAVACVWRVVILSSNKRSLSKSVVSARVLAACLRIDSYFNPLIIPNIQIALNIGVLHISLYNHIDTTVYNNLPPPLDKYTLNGKIPEIQCFMSIEQKRAILVFNKWMDNSTLVDIGGTLSVHVLDYSHLTMQEVLDALEGRFQLSLSSKTDASLTCSPFTLKLGPAITHTLTVSTHLWLASFNEEEKTVIILTRYVIANDSNISIRFGQSGTGDSILLENRQCNFYSWRQIGNQMIRISIEEQACRPVWSRPFPVNKDGTQVIEFNNSTNSAVVFVNVTSLSATQKLVTFSGQLVISNQLIDNFEMRLVKYEAEVGSKVTVSKEVYPIPGKSFPSSIVLESNKKMAMRLRFTNLTHLSWTGDIPLQPNVKWGQPWLVKVPLQERGQFLSIWVRIVAQTIQEKVKILAVLSPLYMIRSHLPVPARVQIETPSLKTTSCTTVIGRGECQQLYCPGTFEHFHQLTFQLESGVSASNPYVPLSYSSVDQRKFFRRPEVEDIDKILRDLKDRKDEVKWPFQEDDMEDWISAEQPQTHVQVKYQDAGLVSSTLLLELQPWCFVMNSLGCHISLVSEDTELCQIPHYGIVTPPKLEGTFYVGVGIGDTYYTSQTLQLTRPDWNQGFYMPRINGLIPVEGNIKTSVDCGTSVSILNIGSSMHEDMRLVRITSSHVIANLTTQELCVATLAVHEEAKDLQLPHDLTPCSLNILPSEDQRQGTPIVQWYTLYTESNVEPLVLYVSFSLGHRWSCPIRVDQTMSRKSVAIPNGSSSMPIIVTTQEDKDITFIVIHVDDHPQLLIENACGFKVLLGQADESGNKILSDSAHFSWICEIDSGATFHYSLPCVSSRLPDTAVPSASNVLLFSTVQNDQAARKGSLKWSRGVNLSALSSTPIDQYLRLPSYGDVKLIMQNCCYTIHISIVPISQIEISAQDIRSRLLRKKNTAKDYDATYDGFSPLRSEEEKVLAHIQSSSSSTSLTSFFSAEEDALPAEQIVASSAKQLISKSTDTKLCTDESQSKSIGNVNSSSRKEGSATVYLRACTIVILHDINENAQRIEVASLSMTDVIVTLNSKGRFINLYCYISDLQLDNQLFDQGGFDFPVVLISQNPLPNREQLVFYSNNCLMTNLEKIKQDSLIAIEYVLELNGNMMASKEYRMKIAPISAYIEDTYVTQLLDYATSMIPPRLVLNDTSKKIQTVVVSNAVYIPDYIMIDSKILSKPLRLQTFVIEPLSILLSVHTSVRLYVALDHSPLYFGTFERKNLLTTPYRLGNTLTMHYLSGAIFGAGWIVGSLEILGSPGGLAQALGSGLRDFVSLPFQGLLQGPWGFIVGITHGSASLMKHVTAGTVNSVTKLASSVARNLDRLTLDEEHLQRQEESRRMRPQGMAQGLYQGLTGFGMSLLAAVAGLAHHPLQQVWSGEATTKSLVTGVGLGLVGVVTKPLSGAAELVALTGQGLLQGAGWNSLPTPRQRSIVQYTTGNSTSVRYIWRLSSLLDHSHDSILHVTSADYVIHQGSNRAVTLVLTRQALLLVNMAEDSVERIFSLKELTSVDHITESTMLCLYCPPAATQTSRPLSPTEHEMNQEMRARVEEYVRTSSTGLASVSTNSDRQSDTFERVSPHPEHTLTFYVCPDTRNYLLSLFNIAKRQNQGSGFTVL